MPNLRTMPIYAGNWDALNDVVAEALTDYKPQTMVLIGDSILGQEAAGSDGVAPNGSSAARGFWAQAQLQLRQRFLLLNNAGVGGNTNAVMLSRLSTDVLIFRPGYVVVQASTNDAVNDVPAATTMANLAAIYTACVAQGIKVVACTLMPSASANNAARKLAIQTVNNWIRIYAQTQPGVLLCDWYPITADATTGAPATNMTYDAIVHPSQMGAYLMGTKLASVLAPITTQCEFLPQSNADAGLTLPNPRMVGTGGTGTGVVAASVSITATSGAPTLTGSKVTRTDMQGEWQQIVASAGTDSFFVQQQSTTNAGGGFFSVGDRVFATAEVEIDSGATMVNKNGEVPVCLQIVNQDAGGVFITNMYAATGEGTYPGAIPTGRLGLRTPNFLLAAGTSRLFIRVTFFLNGTVRVGRMQVYKATAGTIYG